MWQALLLPSLSVIERVLGTELEDAGILARRGGAIDLGARALGDLRGGDAETPPPAECTSTRSPRCTLP
jgi:hypothetical protein